MKERLRPWQAIRLQLAAPIVVATKNQEKFREIFELWGEAKPLLEAAGAGYRGVYEAYDSYEQNAVLKAFTLAQTSGRVALADDSGIEVEALDWGPGVRSARTPSPDASPRERNENILKALQARPDSRRARMVCACALVVAGFQPIFVREEVLGSIAYVPAGDGGFGYDPIFYYPPYGCTFAEAGADAKHAVSHRGRAVRALRVKIAPLVTET